MSTYFTVRETLVVQNANGNAIFTVDPAAGTITMGAGFNTVAGAQTATGAQTFLGTVTVGVDDTGQDVQFFGATSGKYMLWDESENTLKLAAGAGLAITAQTVTPNSSEVAGNTIAAGVTAVAVAANTNGVDDFIVLPALSSVPVGHCITVVSNAAGHEVRTPATSAEEINSEDCDGTKEYAIAAGGEIHRFTKIDNTTGWMGQGFTALGAVVSAVVPD